MERGDLLNCRRIHDVRLRRQNREIVVRNQVPLDPESIELNSTETFEGYVGYLNTHVFFWPGTVSGPTFDGVRMFRNAGVDSALIRVPTRSLIDANDRSLVHLSTCNAGASWMVEGGKKSQRGSDLFQQAETFAESPERIEEISFRWSVNLPDDSECSTGVEQPWRLLFVRTHDGGVNRCDVRMRHRRHVLTPLIDDPW